MAVDPVTTDVKTRGPIPLGDSTSSPENQRPAIPPGEAPAREEAATGVQFGPGGPSADVFHKPEPEPSVFDIELPETAPIIRIRIGDKKTEVSFWTLFDLCTKYENEFINLPWEAFAPIAWATLGVETLDIIQWRVLLTHVENLMKTKLKKNFQFMQEASALRERNLAASSDSPKPSPGV